MKKRLEIPFIKGGGKGLLSLHYLLTKKNKKHQTPTPNRWEKIKGGKKTNKTKKTLPKGVKRKKNKTKNTLKKKISTGYVF